eukprot:345365-Prymnesium_polylepis.3
MCGRLQTAVAEAKAASQGARDRHRLKQPAEEDDVEAAKAYSVAKVALNEFLKTQPGSSKPAAAQKQVAATAPEDTAPTAAPAPAVKKEGKPMTAPASAPRAPEIARAGKWPDTAPGGPNSAAVYTAEELGVSQEERRKAKKEAKRAARKEQKKRT